MLLSQLVKMENYFEWYLRESGAVCNKQLLIDLCQEQQSRCLITGLDFIFEPLNILSPVLKDNTDKCWLPRYEFVCLVFRKSNFRTPLPKKKEETPVYQEYSDEDYY